MSRKKIPEKTVTEIFWLSDMCCFCGKRGDHIHHIDENPGNNHIDNLVFLCFDHHKEASVKGGLSRKPNPGYIKRKRNFHYELIASNRKKQRAQFNISSRSNSSFEDAYDAVVIHELEKLKKKFYSTDWKDRLGVLSEFEFYGKKTNPRIAFDYFEFIRDVASITRSGMTTVISQKISWSISSFFPYLDSDDEHELQLLDTLLKKLVYIGSNIFYDSVFYLENLKTGIHGLQIMKYVSIQARNYKHQESRDELDQEINSLKHEMDRKDGDLELLKEGKELINIYINNMDDYNLTFSPQIPSKYLF